MTLTFKPFLSSKRTIELLLVCLCFWMRPAYGDNFIDTLPRLESDLLSAFEHAQASDPDFNQFDWTDVGKLQQATQLEALGPLIWIEVLERTPNSASARVCYLCILRHREDLATCATFLFLLAQPQPMMIAEVSDAGTRLRSLAPTQENLNEFTALMRKDFQNPESRLRVAGVIGLLPTSFIETWWMSKKSVVLAPTSEALVLNRLAALKARGQLSADCDMSVDERLETLAVVPGFPRLVHVANSSGNDERITRELQSLIADEAVSDLEFGMATFFKRDLVRRISGDLFSVKGETATRRSAAIRKTVLGN